MDETGLYMDRVGTPLGDMIMTSHGEALLGLWFQGERYEPGEEELAGARRNPDLPVFQETRRWLELYFQGKDPGFTPPLELSGSVFRQQVGRIMLTKDPDLWGHRPGDGRKDGEKTDVGPGRRRRRGPQPHQPDHSLPPGGGVQRKPDWIRRRHAPEGVAAGT